MVYICPTCNKEFSTTEGVSAHYLKCWKNNNPHHKSKPAPRSKDIIINEISEDIMAFFTALNGDGDNERSNG